MEVSRSVLVIIGVSCAGSIGATDEGLDTRQVFLTNYPTLDCKDTPHWSESKSFTVEGLNESRSVWIVSKHYEQIGDAIEQLTGRKVTYMKDSNGRIGVQRGVILSVITRFEEQKVKSVIHSVDSKAFVVISNAHEILGKNFTT